MACKECNGELRVFFTTKSLDTTMSYTYDCCNCGEALEKEENGTIFPPNQVIPSLV